MRRIRSRFASKQHTVSRPASITVARLSTLCRINYLPIVPCKSRCQPDIQRKLGAVCISVDKPLSLWDKHCSRSERGVGVRAGINKLRIRRGQQKRKTGISVHKPYCPPAVDTKPALTARKTSAATPRVPAALPWPPQSCHRGRSKNWLACR